MVIYKLCESCPENINIGWVTEIREYFCEAIEEEKKKEKYVPGFMLRGENKYKKLKLGASLFKSGCVCGHNFKHRDTIEDTRKRKNFKIFGVTIRPNTEPVKVTLREV